MISSSRAVALLALLLGAGIGCDPDPGDFGVIGGGSGSGDDGDDDGGDDGGDDGDTDDSGDDGEGDDEGFEAPGDVVDYTDNDGRAEISLVDLSEEPGSNQDQEFYLVLVNSSEDELGYQLRYGQAASTEEESAESTAARQPAAGPQLSPFREQLRELIAAGVLDRAGGPPLAPPPPLSAASVGAVQEFRIRNDLEDEESGQTVAATLYAVGDSVTIWVDNNMPFNVYIDCENLDLGYSRYEEDAFGFDNCDLVTIANIVDANIIPHLTDAYGEISDVNDDGKVSIVITPVLNQLTQGTDDEDLEGRLVGSYADPEVDLNDYDVEDNPLSNEQEVIFVHAPDPYGYFNHEVRVSVDAYTGMELAAQIARAYTRLISYNAKILSAEAGGTPEAGWLVEGLGALAADLCGFGAVYYDDVWDYLDAPHLNSLVIEEDAGAISTERFGAQYLFLRWLLDTHEAADPSEGELLKQIMTSTSVGTDSIQGVTGKTFDELVVAWQVSLLTTGVTDADGNPLVDDTDPDNEEELLYPPYTGALTLSAPAESPEAGDYYGANGYQQGVNIRGLNLYMEDGTTDEPTEVTGNRVVTSGTDHLTMVTGVDLYGYVKENYAAQVIRLVDIPYDEARLIIDGATTGYTGVVIRWNDPTIQDYAVENVFSSTSSTTIELPRLPTDGAPVYGVGAIGSPGASYVVDAGAVDIGSDTGDTGDFEYESGTVYDTDRWGLDLTEYPSNVPVSVAIQLSRHYKSAGGDISPADPWLAVVPRNLVPTPTVSGTNNLSCPTAVATFEYPSSIMEHLFWQVFLSPQALTTTVEVDLEGEGGFDPCGEPEDGGVSATTCANDWDRDGVLDENEPVPQSFVQQVQVMQCTLAGGADGGSLGSVDWVGEEIIDRDELDSDDASYFDRTRNLGGRTDASGEDAFMELTLAGGYQYVIVVGAGTDEGPYEFSVQVLDTGTASR